MRKLIIALIVAFIPNTTLAASASELKSWCDGIEMAQKVENTDDFEKAISNMNKCSGFIQAIVGVMRDQELSGFRSCFPKAVPIGEAAKYVQRLYKNMPEYRDLRAVGFAAMTFAIAYPCENSRWRLLRSHLLKK